MPILHPTLFLKENFKNLLVLLGLGGPGPHSFMIGGPCPPRPGSYATDKGEESSSAKAQGDHNLGTLEGIK